MSFFSRLLGRQSESDRVLPSGLSTDEQAVERYRYLLRTAPPETIEQAHADAFAQLTPAQRRLVLDGLNGDLSPQERANSDDPRALARLATRAELRRPGALERTFGGVDPRGAGGFMGGSFLNTVAAVVVGTAIADALFADGAYAEGFQDGADATSAEQGANAADGSYESVGSGYDTAGDLSVGDFGGGEF